MIYPLYYVVIASFSNPMKLIAQEGLLFAPLILAYSQGENSLQHLCGIPMVIFAAEAGGRPILVSDERVRCSDKTEFVSGEFERINVQRSFNFGFDLREDDGWREKM